VAGRLRHHQLMVEPSRDAIGRPLDRFRVVLQYGRESSQLGFQRGNEMPQLGRSNADHGVIIIDVS
jgi:hypothetical protein